jgi:hypothetical protein
LSLNASNKIVAGKSRRVLEANELSNREVVPKEKSLNEALANKRGNLAFAKQVSQRRRDELKAEKDKLASELETAKSKLAAALKEPDKVKEEWHGKI